MLLISYLTAIAASALNASSSVMQRLATSKPHPKRLFSRRFAYEMIKNRLFILGFVSQIAAFIAQAIALKNGPLIIVEPVLTCDLIFLLLLIHWKVGVNIQIRDWLAVSAIILGLSGLFIAANPQEGHLNYQAEPWIILVGILGTLIVILAIIIRRLKNATARAMLAAMAAAGSYALNAAFTKLTLNIYTTSGVVGVMTNWPLYALVVSGATSVYLMLNAYGSGPLAISQPIMEVSEPAIAVAIGIAIFGDSYRTDATALTIGAICISILVGGIVTLSSSPKMHQAGEKGI